MKPVKSVANKTFKAHNISYILFRGGLSEILFFTLTTTIFSMKQSIYLPLTKAKERAALWFDGFGASHIAGKTSDLISRQWNFHRWHVSSCHCPPNPWVLKLDKIHEFCSWIISFPGWVCAFWNYWHVLKLICTSKWLPILAVVCSRTHQSQQDSTRSQPQDLNCPYYIHFFVSTSQLFELHRKSQVVPFHQPSYYPSQRRS